MGSNKPVQLRRSDLVASLIYIGGKPFDFKNREYLIPIYDTFRPVVLKGGRQIEKSTLLAVIMIIDGISHDFFNSLYVSYTQKQVSFFSNLRFDPIASYSPYIKSHFYTGSNLIKRVGDKTFRNGSAFFFRSMYSHHTAESIRGLSADRICFDEVQSLDPRGMSIVEECMSHSPYKYVIYAGTAKSPQNEIERMWNMSTQIEYMIKCEACNHWNYQDEKIIGKNSYICSRCGKPIDMRNGTLVMMGDKYAPYFGMRITQMQAPFVSFDEIKLKYERMPLYLFYNEVLGLPYEFAERPISLRELQACCVDRDFIESSTLVGRTVAAGIDWGGGTRSFTEVVIGEFINGKYKVYYVHRLKVADPIEQVDFLSRLLKTYKVRIAVCDMGFGDMKVQELRALTGIPVIGCYYSSTKVRSIIYKEKENMIHVNRTWALSEVFRLLKRRRFEFPRYSIMAEFFEEILNVTTEVHQVQGQDTIMYIHDAEHPDDFLHALNYFKIACDYKKFVDNLNIVV